MAALDDLSAYIATDGPFDGVMAFSQGAGLAASLMLRDLQQTPQTHEAPLFKCAIFFSGGVPADPVALSRGEMRLLDAATDGSPLRLPTAHIWGRNDAEYPTFGPVLSGLCSPNEREVVVHDGEHEVPGSRDRDAVNASVRAVRRTVERALSL